MRESIRAGMALLLPLTVGVVSGVLTSESVVTWYPTLAKPSFTPPDWLFAPVWTVLYPAMGVAAYGVWRLGDAPGVKRALAVFVVQLLLNGPVRAAGSLDVAPAPPILGVGDLRGGAQLRDLEAERMRRARRPRAAAEGCRLATPWDHSRSS
jgi:hypothetical protein